MSHHSYGSLDDPSSTVSVGRLCLHPEVCFQSLGASRSDERVEKTRNVQKMEVPDRRLRQTVACSCSPAKWMVKSI